MRKFSIKILDVKKCQIIYLDQKINLIIFLWGSKQIWVEEEVVMWGRLKTPPPKKKKITTRLRKVGTGQLSSGQLSLQSELASWLDELY